MTGQRTYALTHKAYAALEAIGVPARCVLCGQSSTFIGVDAPERAQMWLEDGGHYCVDVLGDDDDGAA